MGQDGRGPACAGCAAPVSPAVDPTRRRGPDISTSAARPPAAGRPEPEAGTLAATGEFAVIAAVVDGSAQAPTTLLGPGDDGAVVSAPDGRVVASVDVLVDGVHFRTDWASAEQIGRRAALAAMADIAAMGAVPTALLVGVCAPPTTATAWITEAGRGLQAAAAEAGAAVVGGDLTRSEVLTISVTVLGNLAGGAPVLRSGAGVGDVVASGGGGGWAAAGLAVLSRGFRSPAAAVSAYRVPEPPLAAGPQAALAGATSMIDVSDGLLADLAHVAAASGVGIDVRSATLPVTPRLVEVASALGRNWLEWAVTGGDDHALVATFPADTPLPDGWTAIGAVGPAPDAGPAVTLDGAVWDAATGWDHFG